MDKARFQPGYTQPLYSSRARKDLSNSLMQACDTDVVPGQNNGSCLVTPDSLKCQCVVRHD